MKKHLLLIIAFTLSFTNLNAQGIGPIPGSQIKGTSEILGGLIIDSILKLPIRPLIPWPYANNKMSPIGMLQVNSVDTLPYYLKSGSTWKRLLTTDDTTRFGKGTVTSIGISIPSAFSVTPTTITTSGVFSITATGTTSQYIRGDGSLATTPTGTVTSVSGTAGRISSTGGATPVIDLVTANPTPATSGGSAAIPVITYDAYGRLTSVTTVSPATDGTVTSVSVVSANGFAGTVANATSTPGITLTTTVNANVVKGNGTALIPAVAGTDYQAPGNYITALTGDVTASGSGSAAATIANLAVTNAKIANATIDLTTKVTGLLPLANGGTNANLSATGGAHNFLKQSTTGAAITVGQPALTDLSDYTAMGTNGWSPTIVGYATPPTPDIAQYSVKGSEVTVFISFTGTSNSSLCNFTLPFNSTITYRPQAVRVQNAGNVVVTFLEITSGSNVCVVHASPVDASGFTTSGIKSLITSFTYLK